MSDCNEPFRQPHVASDLSSRSRKAQKIERLLRLDARFGRIRLLEVGCGSGGISQYFGAHPSGRYEVEAVDVHDSRVVCDGYHFTKVEDTALPFADAQFDVIISNHVIEHVGNDHAQAHHLSELRRVLKPDGIGYLAMPNRWMPVEPHYRLMFLSWWPEAWRTTWLRLWRKGDWYDCRPMTRADLQRRLASAGFRYQQQNGTAVRATFEIECSHAPLWKYGLRFVPEGAWQAAGGINPTLIYLLWRT